MATARQEEKIPALHPGDHLSIEEFERRYEAMPDVKKAELIEGVVYIPSPVSADHSDPHFNLIGWLSYYRMNTPGTQGGDNGTLRLEVGVNRPQPDAFLRILEEYGGQSRLSEDSYVEGAPELCAEVAASSASYDLHEKLAAYQRNGVQEYLVWRVEDRALDWFVLQRGKYRPLRTSEGVLKSKIFPGLWLDAAALIDEAFPRVLEVAQAGIASAEHKEFVERLRRKR